MSDWSSNQYLKFQQERTQPARDLASRVNLSGEFTAIDLGCGPGNSTNVLHTIFPQAEIIGVDSSDDMLNKARATYSDMTFKKCVLPDGLSDLPSADLLFSNACLHWIPNHERLFPMLMEKLGDGGCLAVQMPLVQYAPFYKALGELVQKPQWRKLKAVKNFHNLLPEQTYDILVKSSPTVTMWETTYYHIVPSFESVIEWYGGSGLRPYLEMLDENEQKELAASLLEMLQKHFNVRSDGNVILKMPRLFFVAQK